MYSVTSPAIRRSVPQNRSVPGMNPSRSVTIPEETSDQPTVV